MVIPLFKQQSLFFSMTWHFLISTVRLGSNQYKAIQYVDFLVTNGTVLAMVMTIGYTQKCTTKVLSPFASLQGVIRFSETQLNLPRSRLQWKKEPITSQETVVFLLNAYMMLQFFTIKGLSPWRSFGLDTELVFAMFGKKTQLFLLMSLFLANHMNHRVLK